MTRTAKVSRKTSETDIKIEMNRHWSQFLQPHAGILFQAQFHRLEDQGDW